MMGVFEVPVDDTPGAELGSRPDAGATAPVPSLSFGEAEAIGVACFDRWEKMAGDTPPLGRDDLGWADLVQLVWRRGTAALALRQAQDSRETKA